MGIKVVSLINKRLLKNCYMKQKATVQNSIKKKTFSRTNSSEKKPKQSIWLTKNKASELLLKLLNVLAWLLKKNSQTSQPKETNSPMLWQSLLEKLTLSLNH